MDEQNLEGQEFESVDAEFDRATSSRRDSAALVIKRSGLGESNVDGAEVFKEWASSLGIDPMTAWLHYGANVANGTVALYASKVRVPGSMAIRWIPGKKTFSFHLGGVFQGKQTLRPSTTIQAYFTATKDKSGKDCLVIQLRGALSKRKGAADSSGQAAAGKQENA